MAQGDLVRLPAQTEVQTGNQEYQTDQDLQIGYVGVIAAVYQEVKVPDHQEVTPDILTKAMLKEVLQAEQTGGLHPDPLV